MCLLVSGIGMVRAEPMKLAPPTVAAPTAASVAAPSLPSAATVKAEPVALTQDAPSSATPAPRPDLATTKDDEPLSKPIVEAGDRGADGVAAPTGPIDAGGKRLNVVVLGDSLGDGLWAGVYHVMMKDKQFNVIRKSRVATGLVRHDYYNWNQTVRDIAASTRIDIAIVVMGTNDRQVLVEGSARHALFDNEWRQIYAARVDDFTQVLKDAGARVYWMELPVMRSPRFERDMQTFNGIFAARARANGIHFVPTRDLALGADGGYSAYAADRFGRNRLLRAEDGIHFTLAGYELLGERMAEAIRRDMNGEAPLMASTPAAPVASEASQPVVTQAAETSPDVATDAGLRVSSAEPQPAAVAPAYDLANMRPGRSDDWRWHGEAP
ncbi:MAG: DUF459 domain-containing protein [Rhizobiales bacterium]|nr:DUF459 domain-containing protein [Hyphomicrobiales bacterium]